MAKRRRDGDVVVCLKRGRFDSTPLDSGPSLKRSAPFDMEMQRMHKRMRATVPTAEEAMAFLLPHLLEFRKLYLEAEQRANELECQLQTLKKGYASFVKLSQEKTHLLERQLDMARYQMSLLGPRPMPSDV